MNRPARLLASTALAFSTLSVLSAISAPAAHAQYPERTVRIVVPYATGGGIDTIARLLAVRLSTLWGKSVVVDNRPGAGSVIGTDHVAKAAPDGYTLLMAGNTITINAASGTKLPYNLEKDFVPVALAGSAPIVLVVGPAANASTVKELIAVSRTRPGGVNLASAGTGGLLHLGIELLKSKSNITAVHVPYKALAGAVTDVIGGTVDGMFTTPVHSLQHVRRGTLKALAVTTPTRMTQAPEIPTMREAGVDFDLSVWFGLMAPAGTPASIVSKVANDTRQALNQKEALDSLASQGMEAGKLDAAEFARLVKTEVGTWAQLIKDTGVKLY